MLNSVSWKTRVANILLEIIVALLLILWIYTGISKLYDFQNFKTQLGKSPFIGQLSTIIAYSLPIFEIALGLALIFTPLRKLALLFSFGLMLLFTGYIYIMLYYAYDLPCSCGGVIAKMTWHEHLFFNIGYTLLALIGILLIHGNSASALLKNSKFRIAHTK